MKISRKDDKDLLLSAYDYDLPSELIAQYPMSDRKASRLLVYNRVDNSIEHSTFDKLDQYIPRHSLLVANNSKVVPARLTGQKTSGGKVECLLLSPLAVLTKEMKKERAWWEVPAECLLKGSKLPKINSKISISDRFEIIPLEHKGYGMFHVLLRWKGDLLQVFEEKGQVPLPPYVKRDPMAMDEQRYQTVYARDTKAGSVAAPTAGLHFTPNILEKLKKNNISWAEITLYVGYGTFSPIRNENLLDHVMHHEFIEIESAEAETIEHHRAQRKPIVAVGTTTVRSLESVIYQRGKVESFHGWSDLFIKPGYVFKGVDHMITNFHLPLSSLLVMISAFAGRENMLKVYEKAVAERYRFFSYGDAMLIL